VEAILMNWELNDVRDVKDAQEKEFRKMYQKVVKEKTVGKRRKPVRTEKLPDWFTEENDRGAQVEEHDEEFEAEKAKLKAELEEYRARGSYRVLQG
jgi:DNA replication protein DnaD